jgi:ATP-dependent RNA helicase RhlE
MTFEDLGLSAALLKAVQAEGYLTPTPIQQQAIGPVLEARDLVGIAQTGTGKTAAFALPILQRLAESRDQRARRGRKARVLVLSPTRELATQIAASFATYGRHTGLKQTVVYGGVSQHPQAQALRAGVDILVATPGRLLDLMNQGLASLAGVEILVIDEADRMFDMGFIRDIRKIVATLPRKRQTLLFSATMPDDIRKLADTIMSRPVEVKIAAKNAAADTVEQSVYFVEKRNKPALLAHLIAQAGMSRALVFTRTKHGADKVARHLSRSGIRAEAIHGNKTQNARQRALLNFKSHRPPVLVATDVAARGLDIDLVSHVINYDLPNVPETYVHRIGRTGRAGAAGIAVSFCAADEREHLRAIEKLLRKKTPVCDVHPQYAAADRDATPPPAKKSKRRDPRAGGHKPHAANAQRSSGAVDRKPHGAGPADGRQRSRRRQPVARPAVPARPSGYTTMW